MIIKFDPEAIKFLKKCPDKKRIFDKLISAKENPMHYFSRLKGRKEYSLRVGDYRVIADIDKAIYIHFIGHRRNVYD